ncbi:MAG TPA: carboxypeptidase regulatory-like domain-containing protein [Gemmatimonadales bacterium]|jgi:hypothetical protein|nr:carboxypeptidase regulatory-like domain-containing protein [Gemmatimonadales bacterium]
MRVPLLVLGLVSAPVIGALAQGAAAVKDPAQCAVADEHRSPTSYSHVRNADPLGRPRTGCSPVAPTPPPPPPPPPSGGSISGTVRNSSTGSGLAGWVVNVFGPTTTSATTDANGNYQLTGLADGTYTVCEVVEIGWSQASPMFPASCPSGFGYTFGVSGGSSTGVNFGNMQP